MLTDPQVKNAKPAVDPETGKPRTYLSGKNKGQPAPYKLHDALGLYVLVKPDGGKYWRLKYRYAGREKLLALGVYPTVTLSEARKERDKARAALAEGRDPAFERKVEKQQRHERADNTFKSLAEEWFKARTGGWSKAHTAQVRMYLDKHLLPKLGSYPIADITPRMVLTVLRGIEATGALEIASKARGYAGQVFRYAVAEHAVASDPTRDLRGALKTREKRHYAALKDQELPAFLRNIDAYDSEDGAGGATLTRLAITLLALTFVRTAELRGATWSEINVDKREWRIPKERMKGGREHIVPLSDQAVTVLEQLREISGSGDLIFPNEQHADRPMSENTILYALYRMGYRGRATGHGMRHTASTILNEMGFNPDWIERQLAHVEKNKIRGAYNAAEYLPGRRQMMQAWADFLDAKRAAGDNVVSIGKRA